MLKEKTIKYFNSHIYIVVETYTIYTDFFLSFYSFSFCILFWPPEIFMRRAVFNHYTFSHASLTPLIFFFFFFFTRTEGIWKFLGHGSYLSLSGSNAGSLTHLHRAMRLHRRIINPLHYRGNSHSLDIFVCYNYKCNTTCS